MELELFVPPIATKIHCNCDDILISGQNIVCISFSVDKFMGFASRHFRPSNRVILD